MTKGEARLEGSAWRGNTPTGPVPVVIIGPGIAEVVSRTDLSRPKYVEVEQAV